MYVHAWVLTPVRYWADPILIGEEKHRPSLSMTRLVPSASAFSISIRVYLGALLAFVKDSCLRLLRSIKKVNSWHYTSTEFNFCFDYLLNN